MYRASIQQKQVQRKILMYGQAVLLRHQGTKKVGHWSCPAQPNSGTCCKTAHFTIHMLLFLQLLRCLSSSPAGDKLAHHIGFSEKPGWKQEWKVNVCYSIHHITFLHRLLTLFMLLCIYIFICAMLRGGGWQQLVLGVSLDQTALRRREGVSAVSVPEL